MRPEETKIFIIRQRHSMPLEADSCTVQEALDYHSKDVIFNNLSDIEGNLVDELELQDPDKELIKTLKRQRKALRSCEWHADDAGELEQTDYVVCDDADVIYDLNLADDCIELIKNLNEDVMAIAIIKHSEAKDALKEMQDWSAKQPAGAGYNPLRAQLEILMEEEGML